MKATHDVPLGPRNAKAARSLVIKLRTLKAKRLEGLILAKLKYQVEGETPDGPTSFGATLEPAGLALSGLVIGDMGKVDLFARVGVFYADTDVKLSASLPGQSESDSFSDSTEEFFWGLGGNYQFADRWSARIEYRNFDKVGDSSSAVTADVNTLNLGIVYTLGRM